MDGYPSCCSSSKTPLPSAAPMLNPHAKHESHHLPHHQQASPQTSSNPVVFYVPNQPDGGGYGPPLQPPPSSSPYAHHQKNNYGYNYSGPAPYQQQQQQIVEQQPKKHQNYPSIYNNNSKLNIFQPFYSGNIYEEANKCLMVSDSGGSVVEYGHSTSSSYSVANSANSPTGGNLSSASSGYFSSSNSCSPSTSGRSTSRCDSARSVESSCSSTDSDPAPHPYYAAQQNAAHAPQNPHNPHQSNNNNNFVLVGVNSSQPQQTLNFPCPVSVSGGACVPQQRLHNVPKQQSQGGKQSRTDIAVPYGWRRLLVNNTIVYVSPSGFEICSREVAREYLITPGNCKCGLECPLHLDNVFCFDPKVTNRAWPLMGSDSSEKTRLCNHKRKQQVPAALLASAPAAPNGPRSPLHRNLIPNPSKDGQLCEQVVGVGSSRKKRRKVEAAPAAPAAPPSPYDRNMVSHLMAQRERLEPAPTAPAAPNVAQPPNKDSRVWESGVQQVPPPHPQQAQMPPPHYAHHHPHLQPPPRLPCHPMMASVQQQQQQQQQYRGFPPPPPPGAVRQTVTSTYQNNTYSEHMRAQRLPPPPYMYPSAAPGGGNTFYPQQPPPPQPPQDKWPYDKEAHQVAWNDLAKRKKLKLKKKAAAAPPPAPPPEPAQPSFMEDPNGYLAQQTALLNSTIQRQTFPVPSTPVASTAAPTTTTITVSTAQPPTPAAPQPKVVPLASNVSLPKGINRTAAVPDSASGECQACLIKEESGPCDPKGPIQGGTVSTSQEQQQEKRVASPCVGTSTPAPSTKSPLEMVQSVVSSIPAAPKLALPPPVAPADLKLAAAPTSHFLFNGQQLIIQGAAPQKLPPPPSHQQQQQNQMLSALGQPMMQLVNALQPCATPLLLQQSMEGQLLAALPPQEDPKKRSKKRRPIQQAPPPPLQQPQQLTLQSQPMIMQNFQQPLSLQTVTILPPQNKQPQHQFLLPQQTNPHQQQHNLLQPLNLLNSANFSCINPIQTLVMPGLQGHLQVMSTLPDGTLMDHNNGGNTTVQLQLPNQILMQPQFGQLAQPQMLIRAPGHHLLNKITTAGQLISPQSQFLGFQQTLNGLTMVSQPAKEHQQQFIMNVNGQPVIIPCSTHQTTPTTQTTPTLQLQQNTTIVQQQTTTALVAPHHHHLQSFQVNPLILKQFQDLTGPLLLQQKHSASTQTAQATTLLPTMVQMPNMYNSQAPIVEQMPPDTTTASPLSEPLKSVTPLSTDCGVTSSEPDPPTEAPSFRWTPNEQLVESSSDKRKVVTIAEVNHLSSLQVGDLIWGPANGCPSWPGKVVSLSEKVDGAPDPHPQPSPPCGKVWVRWFGAGGPTPSQVHRDSVKSLSDGLEAHHRATKNQRKGRKMNEKLEKAIEEAMEELDKMGKIG